MWFIIHLLWWINLVGQAWLCGPWGVVGTELLQTIIDACYPHCYVRGFLHSEHVWIQDIRWFIELNMCCPEIVVSAFWKQCYCDMQMDKTLPIWELIVLLNWYNISINVRYIKVVLCQVLGGVEVRQLTHGVARIKDWYHRDGWIEHLWCTLGGLCFAHLSLIPLEDAFAQHIQENGCHKQQDHYPAPLPDRHGSTS